MFRGTPFGHFNILRRGTLDWSYSRIQYAKICDYLNRYMHLNYLCSPDTWILPCNECQNKWFSEWIPCIFGPEYGQSNLRKVKIRRPERSHSAVRPKIDPVSRAISTSTLASGQALHLWRARPAARKRGPLTCVPFRALLSRDFSRLPQLESLLAGYPNSWPDLFTFSGGSIVCLFIMATEYVGPNHRAMAGTFTWYFWTGALMLIALLAYLVRDWRKLSIITSAPGLILFVFWM